MNKIQTLRRRYFAGSQMWFSKDKRYGRNRRIHDYGCGVVALMDFAVYRGIEKEATDKAEYMKAVDQMERKWMHIFPGFGISPYVYALWANLYLRKKKAPERLHRIWLIGTKKTRLKRLQKIIRKQLKKDIPLIFAAGPLLPMIGKNKRIMLYRRVGMRMVESGHDVKSHYMTITGIGWMQDRECYIRVASWGEFWYIKLSDYMEYGKYTLLFTNTVYKAG